MTDWTISKRGKVINFLKENEETSFRWTKGWPKWISTKRGGITTTRLGWLSIQHVRLKPKVMFDYCVRNTWVDDGTTIPPYPGN